MFNDVYQWGSPLPMCVPRVNSTYQWKPLWYGRMGASFDACNFRVIQPTTPPRNSATMSSLQCLSFRMLNSASYISASKRLYSAIRTPALPGKRVRDPLMWRYSITLNTISRFHTLNMGEDLHARCCLAMGLGQKCWSTSSEPNSTHRFAPVTGLILG